MRLFESPVPTLARRFLFSKSADGFLSFITWVSVLGVALGVLALTVVTSVINGFEGELVRVITSVNGDVLLYSRADPVSNPEEIEAEVRKVLPKTDAITRSFVAEVMIAGPKSVSGAVLQGVEPERLGNVTEIPKRVIAGRFLSRSESNFSEESAREIVLGSALAEKLGAREGSEIRVIAPFIGGGSHAAPKVLKATVVGIVHMGMYDYDSKFLFMSLPSVQAFYSQPGKVTNFNIKLKPLTPSRQASDQLTQAFDYPFRAKDWSQLNKNLFYAIKLEKVVIAIILTVIVIVAAFNVVSTLMMMIHDKTKEIAILKAMGLRPFQSFQLFCMIGLGIGAVGTFCGVLGGLGLGWLIGKTNWIRLPEDIYYIGFLPVVIHWKEIGWIALMAVTISFLATLYPSWALSRRSPLEGLRYE